MSADFIDSNVFIYLFDDVDDGKRATAERIVTSALASGAGIISYQVAQETINVLTRKLGAPAHDVLLFLDAVLAPLWRISPSPELYREALMLSSRYGFSFYDSTVVAAARLSGCSQLLTEDLQDGQHIGDLKIVNPFASTR